MNSTYSLDQLSETGSLGAHLILRHYNLGIMSRFTEIKSNHLKLTQKQIAQQLGFSNSTIKIYGDQINMPSPCNKKNTKREKMSWQDGSISVKGGICESENDFFSVNDLIDKAFNKN